MTEWFTTLQVLIEGALCLVVWLMGARIDRLEDRIDQLEDIQNANRMH